jgi:hypothetical protein
MLQFLRLILQGGLLRLREEIPPKSSCAVASNILVFSQRRTRHLESNFELELRAVITGNLIAKPVKRPRYAIPKMATL